MGNPAILPAILVAFAAASGLAAPIAKPDINQAAALYHQAQYDSSLASLKALESGGPWKRRDSLSLFQYLGMANAMLGHDSEAVAGFSRLLELDSLFQFPRNEDSLILKDFAQANRSRTERAASVERLIEAAPPAPTPPMTRSKPDPLYAGLPPHETQAAVNPGKIGFAYGALPLGSGWVAKKRMKTGLALGMLQAGGILLSVYASETQQGQEDDRFGIKDRQELSSVQGWQWAQRVSLSVALGAYLFSLIASAGD